jgi:predicted nucleotidyltransferase
MRTPIRPVPHLQSKGNQAMTYQGERARPMASEKGRTFEVSKIRLDADGHVSEVLWGEVNPGSDLDVGPPVRVPVADVVDALHDGAQVTALFAVSAAHLPDLQFTVIEHDDGRECIVLQTPGAPGRQLADMVALDD